MSVVGGVSLVIFFYSSYAAPSSSRSFFCCYSYATFLHVFLCTFLSYGGRITSPYRPKTHQPPHQSVQTYTCIPYFMCCICARMKQGSERTGALLLLPCTNCRVRSNRESIVRLIPYTPPTPSVRRGGATFLVLGSLRCMPCRQPCIKPSQAKPRNLRKLCLNC